uniref:Hydroxysteroid 17-beta dehydrogenase 11 n=1 Tax=Heterorhabditis bacteriophora TaxID=37862 RepID=A0A1I7WJ50_HETBA
MDEETYNKFVFLGFYMYDQWSFKILSTIGVIIHLLFIDIPKDLFRWLTLREKCVYGQTVVITGAASGLGKRMAQILALEKGAKIAVIDMNLKGANETVSSIKQKGGHASAFECDIRSESQLSKLAKQIETEFGQVDIVICNAAVLSFAFFMDLPSDQLKQSMDVNVLGTINTIRAFLGKMEERNSGQIVCVSSIAGFSGETYGLAYW